MILSNAIFAQNDSINTTKSYNLRLVTDDFETRDITIDTFGMKQGLCRLKAEIVLITDGLYENMQLLDSNIYEEGFYIDNKKEGLWEVITFKKRRFKKEVKQIILAHRLYVDDSIMFEIQYNNKKVKNIVDLKMIYRKNSIYPYSFRYKSIIVFDNKGRLKYMQYVSPDNRLEKSSYL